MANAESLTTMQKRYIWLAGSYPELLLIQGRGYRTKELKYGIDRDAEELVVFGYSNPCYFLENRGIFRRGQAPHSYVLTNKGEALFKRLLAAQEGLALNRGIREVRIKRG